MKKNAICMQTSFYKLLFTLAVILLLIPTDLPAQNNCADVLGKASDRTINGILDTLNRGNLKDAERWYTQGFFRKVTEALLCGTRSAGNESAQFIRAENRRARKLLALSFIALDDRQNARKVIDNTWPPLEFDIRTDPALEVWNRRPYKAVSQIPGRYIRVGEEITVDIKLYFLKDDPKDRVYYSFRDDSTVVAVERLAGRSGEFKIAGLAKTAAPHKIQFYATEGDQWQRLSMEISVYDPPRFNRLLKDVTLDRGERLEIDLTGAVSDANAVLSARAVNKKVLSATVKDQQLILTGEDFGQTDVIVRAADAADTLRFSETRFSGFVYCGRLNTGATFAKNLVLSSTNPYTITAGELPVEIPLAALLAFDNCPVNDALTPAYRATISHSQGPGGAEVRDDLLIIKKAAEGDNRVEIFIDANADKLAFFDFILHLASKPGPSPLSDAVTLQDTLIAPPGNVVRLMSIASLVEQLDFQPLQPYLQPAAVDSSILIPFYRGDSLWADVFKPDTVAQLSAPFSDLSGRKRVVNFQVALPKAEVKAQKKSRNWWGIFKYPAIIVASGAAGYVLYDAVNDSPEDFEPLPLPPGDPMP